MKALTAASTKDSKSVLLFDLRGCGSACLCFGFLPLTLAIQNTSALIGVF